MRKTVATASKRLSRGKPRGAKEVPAATVAQRGDTSQTPAEELPWPLNNLSRREREILRLIGEGCSIRKAGAALGLSPKTVQTYCDRIKRKLMIRSGAELRQVALLNRVVEPTVLSEKLSPQPPPAPPDLQPELFPIPHSCGPRAPNPPCSEKRNKPTKP
ncbi:MAG: LuxR C-terminal-related transcriptional regulator [Verrucomicrobiae bacterium]|nr:LuxR C-terminal-related transcriptional regulator [Verrucomicrobiae bacterium]